MISVTRLETKTLRAWRLSLEATLGTEVGQVRYSCPSKPDSRNLLTLSRLIVLVVYITEPRASQVLHHIGLYNGLSDVRSSYVLIQIILSHEWASYWQKQGSPRSKRTAAPQPPPETTLSESQTQFLSSILGEALNVESPLQEACAWYIIFLEFKIKEAWIALFREVLIAANPLTDEPSSQELSVAFAVLKTIVRESSERESLALTNLVDALYNENDLRYTDEERSLANQLAFAAFGWISMLNVPSFKLTGELILE